MKRYLLSKDGRASRIRTDQAKIKEMVGSGWNVDGEMLDNGTVSAVSFVGEEKPKKKAIQKKKAEKDFELEKENAE